MNAVLGSLSQTGRNVKIDCISCCNVGAYVNSHAVMILMDKKEESVLY